MTNDHDNPLASLRRSVDERSAMDAAAADRLEARLRVAHAEARRTPPPWRRPAVVTPLVVMLVAALTFVVVARGETPSSALVMTDAANVTVVLPDGTVVTDPADGFELPDGAIVEIEPGGTATIDDVVVDTPVVLSVRDGRLVADVAATTTTAERPDHLEPTPSTAAPPADVVTTTVPAPTTSPSTVAPTTTAAVPAPTDTAARDDGAPSSTTTVRDGEPVDEQRAGDGERERDAERDGDDRRDPGDVDRSEDDLTLGITLDLRRADPGVEVGWDVTGLEPGWSIVVVRTIGDTDASTVVRTTMAAGSIVDRPTRDDGRPVERRLHYRLVVLDEAGGEVASGPRQSLR